MAEKEATVFIVDVGGSMGNPHSGREESDLNWSMRYVWDRIASAVRLTHVRIPGLYSQVLDLYGSKNFVYWSSRFENQWSGLDINLDCSNP